MYRGFTLFEILIVLGMLGCIVLFSGPVGLTAFQEIMIRTDASVVESIIRTTQLRSLQHVCSERLCDFAIHHSVHISAHELTVFEGASYEDRNTEQDVVIPLFGNERLESTGDIVTASTGAFTASETVRFLAGASSTLEMSVSSGETGIQQHL